MLQYPTMGFVKLKKKCNSNNKGVATRSEKSNEIVSITTYLRKTIVTTVFANNFVRGGHVELFVT